MGDMADMLIDQGMGGMWEDHYEPSEVYYARPKKILKCNACRKPNLTWRMIQGQWVLFEPNEHVHSCSGYIPPLEVLKELAQEVLAKTQKDIVWRNLDRAKKRGGLLKLIPILPDEQLVDLLEAFLRDKWMSDDDRITYKKEIDLLKKEIVSRMSK